MRITINVPDSDLQQMFWNAGYEIGDGDWDLLLKDKEFLELVADDILTLYSSDVLESTEPETVDGIIERYTDVMNRLGVHHVDPMLGEDEEDSPNPDEDEAFYDEHDREHYNDGGGDA